MLPLTVFLADYLIILPFLLTVGLFFSPGQRKVAVISFINAAIAWIVSFFIKDFFYYPRPFILSGSQPLVNHLLDGTFPSSHAALAFGLAFSVFFQHRRAGLIMLCLAVLISTARVYAGVHTEVDVLGGAVVAFILTLVTHNARLLKS